MSHSVTEATVLIFPAFYAMTGGLILQWLLKYNFSVAVWVGYIALFGIAVETGVVGGWFLSTTDQRPHRELKPGSRRSKFTKLRNITPALTSSMQANPTSPTTNTARNRV